MNGLAKKITESYRKGGLPLLLRKSGKKSLWSLFHTNNAFWLVVNMEEFLPVEPLERRDTKVILFPSHKTIEYIKERGYYFPKEISVGSQHGHIFSRLVVDKKIIGYNKLAFNKVYIYDFDRTLTLPDKVAFTYDTMIEKSMRNRGLGTFLLSESLKEARKRGALKVWAHIPPWNKSSLYIHQRVGFNIIKRIYFFYILGIGFLSCNPEKLFSRYI